MGTRVAHGQFTGAAGTTASSLQLSIVGDATGDNRMTQQETKVQGPVFTNENNSFTSETYYLILLWESKSGSSIIKDHNAQ